ncbi:MAG: amino acid permease, partial [Candidatus Eremiobacteraeota bacterium]|nr:amino acid permease [Candidatus Eremiobacteraeota bacterium]
MRARVGEWERRTGDGRHDAVLRRAQRVRRHGGAAAPTGAAGGKRHDNGREKKTVQSGHDGTSSTQSPTASVPKASNTAAQAGRPCQRRQFGSTVSQVADNDRLAALGYKPELSRVLSLFDNFAVAFSYLSPMVGIYSLYTLGLGTGGPRYIWTIPVVVGCMMLVALVFGELASEYPLSGALYQYGKFNVGARYGWYVGWIYGVALLATVASVDSGIVGYVTALSNAWFGTKLDPNNHWTIFAIAGATIVLSATMNSIGAKLMGRV